MYYFSMKVILTLSSIVLYFFLSSSCNTSKTLYFYRSKEQQNTLISNISFSERIQQPYLGILLTFLRQLSSALKSKEQQSKCHLFMNSSWKQVTSAPSFSRRLWHTSRANSILIHIRCQMQYSEWLSCRIYEIPWNDSGLFLD